MTNASRFMDQETASTYLRGAVPTCRTTFPEIGLVAAEPMPWGVALRIADTTEPDIVSTVNVSTQQLAATGLPPILAIEQVIADLDRAWRAPFN